MARIRPDQPLLPSVLDRLLDEQPEVTVETAKPRHILLRELRLAVRRDLENLLNTRCRFGELPKHLKELECSLVRYGLPDFKALGYGSIQDRERIRQILERAVRTYEPRFKSVRVQLLENAEPLDRTLRFRVDAMLHAEPAPEPVVFDSAYEPSRGSFIVKGQA